jgi:hypothetical protein
MSVFVNKLRDNVVLHFMYITGTDTKSHFTPLLYSVFFVVKGPLADATDAPQP